LTPFKVIDVEDFDLLVFRLQNEVACGNSLDLEYLVFADLEELLICLLVPHYQLVKLKPH
jgi:hypothetical protein